jgi:hypothetical protein
MADAVDDEALLIPTGLESLTKLLADLLLRTRARSATLLVITAKGDFIVASPTHLDATIDVSVSLIQQMAIAAFSPLDRLNFDLLEFGPLPGIKALSAPLLPITRKYIDHPSLSSIMPVRTRSFRPVKLRFTLLT